MLLHELKKSSGRTQSGKKLGRGNSNGKGNYCGKGLKGQKSRSGGSIPNWFEGGQTPLYRRLPKLRGFKRYFKLTKTYSIVNIGALELSGFSTGDIVSLGTLREHSLVEKKASYVKILGQGNLTKSLTFDGSVILSGSAKKKIIDAGGSCE